MHLHKADIFTSQRLARFGSHVLSVPIIFLSGAFSLAEEESRNPGQVSISRLSNEYIYKTHVSANAFRQNRTPAFHSTEHRLLNSGTQAWAAMYGPWISNQAIKLKFQGTSVSWCIAIVKRVHVLWKVKFRPCSLDVPPCLKMYKSWQKQIMEQRKELMGIKNMLSANVCTSLGENNEICI